MTKIEEIKRATETLSDEECSLIVEWLLEREWRKWDEQIKKDQAQGKLKFLLEEVREEKKNYKVTGVQK
jgi:hypothetical protein